MRFTVDLKNLDEKNELDLRSTLVLYCIAQQKRKEFFSVDNIAQRDENEEKNTRRNESQNKTDKHKNYKQCKQLKIHNNQPASGFFAIIIPCSTTI